MSIHYKKKQFVVKCSSTVLFNIHVCSCLSSFRSPEPTKQCYCVYVLCVKCKNIIILHHAVPYGNMGCRGGSVFSTYLYMINNGVNTYSCYPYRGRVSFTSFTLNLTIAIGNKCVKCNVVLLLQNSIL